MFRFGKKKRVEEEKKIKSAEDPKNLIVNFDEEAYLEANPTLQDKQKDIKVYLVEHGWNAIANGTHRFHKDFEFFNESKYTTLFSDVKAGIFKGEFLSAYDHFRFFGYDEIIRGVRNYTRSNNTVEISNNKEIIIATDSHSTHEYIYKKKYIDDYPIKEFSLTDFLNIHLKSKEDILLANTYFDQIGYKNILTGKSKFHKDFETYNEEKYYYLYPNIKKAIKEGSFKSGFDHFIHYGYKEIIEGKRFWPKEEKNRDLEKLRFINYRRGL